MPQNILIAALGEHPAVITRMVKALREKEGVKIDVVHVLHTTDTGKYIDREGVKYVTQFFNGICDVKPEPLPYTDPNSYKTSKDFLQSVIRILGNYQNSDSYRVYLSLAGGRKNMSALMALAAQFFFAVIGLYHLLDKAENSASPTWPSIEEMELSMDDAEVQAALDPPLENLELISIPYPGVLGDATKLWDLLRNGHTLTDYPPEILKFYRDKENQREEATLSIYLSEQAIHDYQDLGAGLQSKFINYARRMCSPSHLEAKAHGASGWETDCEVYPEHRANSDLRLFYFCRLPRIKW
jgi:CRISPR-associated Csx14 family protein